jgi:hypothetical protein
VGSYFGERGFFDFFLTGENWQEEKKPYKKNFKKVITL